MPTNTLDSLKQAAKQEARRLGFDLCGVTTPDPPSHYAIYERWLGAGRHGEMGYLASQRARRRRSDPRRILPECRSILVLGMRYWAPSGEKGGGSIQVNKEGIQGDKAGDRYEVGGKQVNREGIQVDRLTGHEIDRGSHSRHSGRVAAYAWGLDYHQVIPEKLHALVGYLEGVLGHKVPNRAYTDTGPLLERDLAQRAGLGWIGKNTCLINPQQGSYLLLAEILLGVELEPDPPFLPDRCGSCTRCMQACPTGCILPDRTIDSRRCVSYLTIELNGDIPLELRPLVGRWVFGCDVCQQVCPWNSRAAGQPGDAAFSPRPDVPRPDLIREMGLTQEEFSRRFRGSPVKRAKRRGYLRNVAVALGNIGAPEAVPVLSSVLLHEPEPLVRAHAAWALGRISAPEAGKALVATRSQESDPPVLEEIAWAQRDG